jgi:hypothetical protein
MPFLLDKHYEARERTTNLDAPAPAAGRPAPGGSSVLNILRQEGRRGFIAGSRDTFALGSQGRQLADVGNARHVCDQLAFHGQG